MAQGAVIADGCGKHIEGDLLAALRQHAGHFRGLGDVVWGEGVDKDRPGVPLVVGHLAGQHVVGLSDRPAGGIVAPD